QLLRVILRKSIDLLSLEKCVIFKVEDSGDVNYIDSIGYDKEKLSEIKLVPAEEYGLAGIALMNKEFIYHRIIADDPIRKHIIEKDKFDTKFAQPLVYNNKIFALLCGSDYGEGITEQQSQRVLSTLANFGAIALQNTELVGKIREQSRRDSLTWLYNHQFFHERLGALINDARKNKEEIAVVIFDVDHFKGFNDTYGHQTGDYVLKTTAQMLQSEFRGDDVVARYGGEEFIVALPKRTEKEAASIADRIRKKLEETAFDFDNKEFSVTASFGVASAIPSEVKTIDRELLVKQADEALYKAKDAGRNRVVVHSSV
ncbi:MAG: sensor domain-containing diguanylate cyclase, partial [Candidatus Omnitrophota bacterium]